MPKRYNTPHRSHVVKTRLTDEEYADFTERLAPYGISQSEFLRQAIRRTTIRPVLHVSSVNDELLNLFYGAVVLARLFPYGEKLSWRTRRLARYRRNVPVCLLCCAPKAAFFVKEQ